MGSLHNPFLMFSFFDSGLPALSFGSTVLTLYCILKVIDDAPEAIMFILNVDKAIVAKAAIEKISSKEEGTSLTTIYSVTLKLENESLITFRSHIISSLEEGNELLVSYLLKPKFINGLELIKGNNKLSH